MTEATQSGIDLLVLILILIPVFAIAIIAFSLKAWERYKDKRRAEK